MQVLSHPMEPFESQNVHDDDGTVLDSLFVETDNPPPIKDAQQPIIVRVLPDTAPTTRMISGDQTLDPTWNEPTFILAADAHRKSLNVYVYSPSGVSTDGVRIVDERGSVLSKAGKLLHNCNINLDGHTGAVWAIDTGTSGRASAVVSLQYWSVTY